MLKSSLHFRLSNNLQPLPKSFSELTFCHDMPLIRQVVGFVLTALSPRLSILKPVPKLDIKWSFSCRGRHFSHIASEFPEPELVEVLCLLVSELWSLGFSSSLLRLGGWTFAELIIEYCLGMEAGERGVVALC
jgi:hypothetical protein